MSGICRRNNPCGCREKKTTIPDQVVVCSRKGTNHQIELLFGSSVYDLKIAEMPPPENLMVREGLRLFTPAASLIAVGETFFSRNPVESQAGAGKSW